MTEDLKNAIFRLPQIYLMDCTLNDCSLILKSLTQVILVDQYLFYHASNIVMVCSIIFFWIYFSLNEHS